ncbi:peptidase M23 [Komagataeibacter nataicola]|uniref:Peptidase M23 n=1 Tax=Komagataeibacter nataicola TaxID=265960 RepID=A0A9N7C897_9PROT|nr:peptidoglycan DD-metalloendopeptidase family protein [Komagataeibacter nataicola]AQU86902.1 peptidase M23 [Komagataeibacter nataicola]PYD67919.1 peptidase M23 [Komagataeibacter nataicola]WEQ56146.1 peptidoglycan DD-metalloendopeptidase family protein [Komagataeibacter nataicola]
MFLCATHAPAGAVPAHAGGSTPHARAGHATHVTPHATTASEQRIREQLEAARTAHENLLAREQQQAHDLEARRKEQQQAREQARADAEKAASLSAATVDATARLQHTEQQAADLDDRIGDLHAEQAALRQQLAAQVARLAPLLPLAERLSLYPADTLLAVPLPADRAVTGLLVVHGMMSDIARQARAIHDRRARLLALDDELGRQQQQMRQVVTQRETQRDAVNRAARAALEAQQRSNAAAQSATQAVEDAARRASSVQDAITRIEETEAQAEKNLEQAARAAERAHNMQAATAARRQAHEMADGAGPGISTTNASAGAPVAGTVLTGWGHPTESGPATGITYAPPSRASVRAPCTGRIDFAGPFRTYGQMMILDCGKHYRFVLAGLGEIAVAAGQQVSRGAAVGQMPQWNGGGSRPTLFVQLRHGGSTVNPAPYL